jgi:hypothetical protein
MGSRPSHNPHKVCLDLETLGASATTGTLELAALAGNVGLLFISQLWLVAGGKREASKGALGGGQGEKRTL